MKKETVNTKTAGTSRPRGRPPTKKPVVTFAAPVTTTPAYPVPVTEPAPTKYHRAINGFWVDVYDFIYAFNITNPGDQNAIKKLATPGTGGLKTANEDREEAIKSVKKAIQLES